MSNPLDRLADLVRQAESKTKAQKLGTETRQAAERLQVAEDRMRASERRLQEDRPIRQRELEQADSEELILKDLIKKLAQSLNSLDTTQQREAEQHISAARNDIDARRRGAMADLEAMLKEADAARRELRAAREQYQALRRDLDQILPHLAEQFSADDRRAHDAETFFPAGQIVALAREVDDGERHFGMLEQREQFAQLKIWIGRFRRLQAWAEADPAMLSEEETVQLREIFPRLVGISKQYMPGYIEAFSRAFETDWDAYVAEATEQLRTASESVRRDRDIEARRREAAQRDQEKQRQARQSGLEALEELKSVVALHHLPDEGLDPFLAALTRAVAGLGMSDPQLLDVVRPYAELLTGAEFRALRRNLERVEPDEAYQRDLAILRDQFRDLVAQTRGLKAVMIGGDIREDKRRSLQQVFEFDELEWVPYESARPVMLKSLEQRVRNHGMELVLILKEFVGHHVSESLRPLCEEHEIPCLMVDHGYGAAQVAEALRRGFARITGVVASPDQSNGHTSDLN